VAAADFGGDDILDLAIASDWWCQAVVPGLGSGRFGNMDYFASPNSRSVNVADLNGDLLLDLIFANSWSSGVSIHLGAGSGSFVPRGAYGSGATPAYVTTADVDGDGRLDIIAANTGDDTASILFGDGSGGVRTTIRDRNRRLFRRNVPYRWRSQ
jgi:hypothetical protein